jgi:2-C-methyl-D-erythritol 4-phosphate cytidylyltransferase
MSVNLPTTRFFALIPCAGSGSRAGTDGPKQYQPIAGKPMVMHTLAAFAAVKRIAKTLVVVQQDDGFFTRNFAPVTAAACGGETRAISVGNGLRELRKLGADSRDWVLVHDAARCLITPELIDSLIDACIDDPVGGLLAQKLPDTLKTEQGGRVGVTLGREDKWLAQTPQMFRIGRLIEAIEQAGDEVTDEAGAIEAVGQKPLLVAGSSQNFKVTYPDDFALAEAVLKGRSR